MPSQAEQGLLDYNSFHFRPQRFSHSATGKDGTGSADNQLTGMNQEGFCLLWNSGFYGEDRARQIQNAEHPDPDQL